MENITIKQLAEYCRDYIDLVSPGIMSRSGKRVRLPEYAFNAEPLLKNTPEINYEDQIILPINLSADLTDLYIEDENIDNEFEKIKDDNLRIALELDDIYRKYETNSYTRQITLEFGYITFKGIPNFDEDKDETGENIYRQAEGYLFSVPIILNYKDAQGQRTYEIVIDDTLIKTNIAFVKNYMQLKYRDDLYKFVALEGNDENAGIPMEIAYVDELWTKITTYLKFSDAIDIIEKPDMSNVVVAIGPKANYFLSQDLSEIIQVADDDSLKNTSLSAWVDKDEEYSNVLVNDNGENDLFFPFAYDKYQLQVLSKINNKGLIVEGPPGTGKSQTISNILVHLAATDKKVLFVSQKDQAVRGVKNKLKTLKIPNLFGYIPDRSSRLYTKEDELDSAVYALRGISQSYLDISPEKDPKIYLANIKFEINKFNENIDETRTFVKNYNEWKSLDIFDFGNNSSNITQAWYETIQDLRNNIEVQKKIMLSYKADLSNNIKLIEQYELSQSTIQSKNLELNQSFKQKYDYKWLNNEEDYIQNIGYEKLGIITNDVIELFEISVIDRKMNIVNTNINKLKLTKELDKILKQLPLEIYETFKSLVFSDKTKTERKIMLKDLYNYFSQKNNYINDLNSTQDNINRLRNEKTSLLSKLDLSECSIGDLNSELNSMLLDDFSMQHFENLYSKDKNNIFDKIHRRDELDSKLKLQKRLNPNRVKEEIMQEKKEYVSQVENYIKNRIAIKANNFRSQKIYRAALESIARKLSKTKKAYKTFDSLKSDPLNFEAMSAVTPIWMMGLDDASRILPLQANLFDYVIIDEASQCNISYTLPVMYRAKHTIFFGDTLQMRDTTISFKSNNQLSILARKHSIPEDLQIKAEGDSVKSVMDIAKLNGFETTILKMHYRSPIELIGFSNENFYAPKNRKLEVVNDNILTTEDGRILKNHFIQPISNTEISSKTNLTEAYYIKQLIKEIKNSETTKDKSIAVLSFFNEQAEQLRKVITDNDVKISAIEGIQGDERDIVIYSFVITSPSEKNRYIALTGESGEIRKEINEGRVNVAFSRARLQVHAVTSLAPNLWPDGIWIKRYLEYIEEHGRINRLLKSEQKFDSHFEEDVYNFLMQKLDSNEYRVSTQVKSCGFYIDQVITNTKTAQKLAIECDGPSHFDDGYGQVRVESDFERQYVLETAHWIFYRISYIDWQQHPESAKKDLIKAIESHFLRFDKTPPAKDETRNPQEFKYNPISIEIPDYFIIEQKQQIVNHDNKNNFLGHNSTIKKSVKEKHVDKKLTSEENKKDKSKEVENLFRTQKTQNIQRASSEENAFEHIMEIQLGNSCSIVVSRIKNGNYWFNEKAGQVFTHKGFGLKPNDWKDFKSALSYIACNLCALEKRFKINESTELVICHPSPDTVDIRQYITSTKYTGWTKKGIRIKNEIAKKIAEQL